MALEASLARQAERLAELGERVTEDDLESSGATRSGSSTRAATSSTRGWTPCCRAWASTPRNRRSRGLAGLSGGERGRVGLAAQLVAPADLVLLDEPTNHLDLETTEWLKNYLREFGETVLVISHDRAFLDDTVDHVLHVSDRHHRGVQGRLLGVRHPARRARAHAVAPGGAAAQADREGRGLHPPQHRGPPQRPGEGAPRQALAAAAALAAAGRVGRDRAPARGRRARRRPGAGGRQAHRGRRRARAGAELLGGVARRERRDRAGGPERRRQVHAARHAARRTGSPRRATASWAAR